MTTIWIVAGAATLIWLLTLRLSVRLVDKALDNGWDNALGYGIVSALTLSISLSLVGTGWGAAIVPLVLLTAQVGALTFIYEIRLLKACLLSFVHAALFAGTSAFVAVVGGAVAIYLLYGKIVSDPLIIIRAILRWLGIDWPF